MKESQGQTAHQSAVTSDHLAAGKFILGLLMWIGPLAMGLVAGYGSAKFTAGASEQRLINAEREIEILKRDLLDGRATYVTRAEIKGYLEGQKDALDQIRIDVRALRQGR